MHVHLLHDIVSVPGLPRSLGAVGALGISLAFSSYREGALGAQVGRCTQKSPRQGGQGPSARMLWVLRGIGMQWGTDLTGHDVETCTLRKQFSKSAEPKDPCFLVP